jgi:hypothetical protein
MNKHILIALLLLSSAPAYAFRPFILHTGKNQVKVLEFYTSEACEKCEASEKWLASLRPDKGLFKKFIAVSFHLPTAPIVEPVNNVAPSGTADPGVTPEPTVQPVPLWVDIFAKPDFSSRKKEAPSFVFNGEDWSWSEDAKLPLDKTEDVGDLSVARNRLKEFEITFSPKEKLDKVNINVALLGSGISRQVTMGGAVKTLAENFVVLEFVNRSLHKSGNVFSGHVKLDMAKNVDVKTFSAVFWTTKDERGDGAPRDSRPIQATGGDLTLQ